MGLGSALTWRPDWEAGTQVRAVARCRSGRREPGILGSFLLAPREGRTERLGLRVLWLGRQAVPRIAGHGI